MYLDAFGLACELKIYGNNSSKCSCKNINSLRQKYGLLNYNLSQAMANYIFYVIQLTIT